MSAAQENIDKFGIDRISAIPTEREFQRDKALL